MTERLEISKQDQSLSMEGRKLFRLQPLRLARRDHGGRMVMAGEGRSGHPGPPNAIAELRPPGSHGLAGNSGKRLPVSGRGAAEFIFPRNWGAGLALEMQAENPARPSALGAREGGRG